MRRFVFGYGSLVNRATHDYAKPSVATINGWRRAWRRAPTRAIPYLTAVRAEGAEIKGLIAEVATDSWADLDHRERAYTRHAANSSVTHDLPHKTDIVIYAIPADAQEPPTAENPILLSYLDVCAEGYAREFGATGIAHFFDTTDGWTGPILDDRNDPIYPRHQPVSATIRQEVDHRLDTLNVKRIDRKTFNW